MECAKWESEGLLYSSEELSGRERDSFVDHMSGCDFCRNEYERYVNEKNTLFSLEILGEKPSEAVDKEIIRLCTLPRNIHTNITFLSLFSRKPAIAVMFLMVGLVAGFFTVSNLVATSSLQTKLHMSSPSSPVVAVQKVKEPAVVAAKDTTNRDSSRSDAASYSKTRGNLSEQGVVPVDVQK